MAWTITHDHISDGADVGVCGPSGERLIDPENEPTDRFKMYDDDHNLYYEGLSTKRGHESGFEPLDDFGTPNAGCTMIFYLEKGKWSQL